MGEATHPTLSAPEWAGAVTALVNPECWSWKDAGDYLTKWGWWEAEGGDPKADPEVVFVWQVYDTYVRLEVGAVEIEADHDNDVPNTMRRLVAMVEAFNAWRP